MGPTRPEHRRSKRFEKPVKWSEISRGCRIGFSPGWTGPEAGEVILEWLMEVRLESRHGEMANSIDLLAVSQLLGSQLVGCCCFSLCALQEVDWQQKNIRVRGREIPQPRLIAYFAKDTSLSYTYSGR
jgi:hypothetical protein